MRKKQLSGAAKRRAAAAKRAAEADARFGVLPPADFRPPPAGPPRPTEDPEEIEAEQEYAGDCARAYAKIGAPPNDVLARVEWAQKMLAQALYETATDPQLEARERRRIIGDLGAKIGITAVKALSEERIKRIEATLYGKRSKGAANARDGLEPRRPVPGPARTD